VETELLLRHPSIGLANTSPQIALAKLSRRKAYHWWYNLFYIVLVKMKIKIGELNR
jgi:hypothetical protein